MFLLPLNLWLKFNPAVQFDVSKLRPTAEKEEGKNKPKQHRAERQFSFILATRQHICVYVKACSYHVELLGDSAFAQLLHAVAHVTKAGVVVLRVFLSKVIYVAQGTILKREREGKF